MSPEKSAQSSEFVTSFAKGLQVIQCFSADHRRMTLSEVAEQTGFSRATARRFLLTLTELGFADNDGKYFELTPKILTLGHAYLSSLSFWDAARPLLTEVTRMIGESCSAGVLDGGEVVYVARSAGPHRIMSVSLHTGTRLPAHATSMGQAVLSQYSDKDLTAFLDRHELIPYTEHTITQPAAFRARMADIKQKGYALIDQELELGLRSIAVPLLDMTGACKAAINVSGHSGRVSREVMIEKYLPHLNCAADKFRELPAE